jgi:hypothetical protein
MNQVRPNKLLALLTRAHEALLFDNLNDFPADRHTVLQRGRGARGIRVFPHVRNDLYSHCHGGWRVD